MNTKIKVILLISVIVLAVILRFYRLEDVPAGFHQDEVSQAYNAFSIAKTGHDRYGEFLPILFRSFGSYQPPVYTYLSVIPMLVFGNTVFSARFLSALAGVFIVALTYLIIEALSESKYKYKFALFGSLIVAISPWAIHFSRRVVEGNVGLCFFLLSLYLFIRSLKNIKFFPLAALVLGIATHAYYSERVIGTLFLPIFLIVFKNYFLKYKKIAFMGLIIFGLTQIPHIWILTSGAFARRFDQVTYFANDTHGLPRVIYIAKEFVRHYLIYLSPSNLFADTGSDLARVSPDLGVFYSWLFIPFLLGVSYFANKIRGNLFKIAFIVGPISLIPASLTGDLFYPLRTLEYLWFVSIIIGLGLMVIYDYLRVNAVRWAVLAIFLIFSLFSFYISYFILFQYETTEYMGASYIKLGQYLDNYKDKKIVIDSARDFAIGARIAYFKSYDPNKMAANLRPQLKSSYYSSEVGLDEIYRIDNIEVRPTIWIQDRCSKGTILVGDTLAISQDQVKEHHLLKVFDIESANGQKVLIGYATNPDSKCK
jgi:4-amino-4-deoxy-L-arabinose transferase-like glycosyltransferase